MRYKFLAISGFFPFPPTNGFTMRVSGLLRALSACGVSIDLLSFGERPAAERGGPDIREICDSVECVPHEIASLSQTAGHFRRLSTIFSSQPYAVKRFHSEPLRERVSELLKTSRYDALLCETPYMAVNLPSALPAPLIIDSHNVENRLLFRYLPLEKNPLKRCYARLEGRKMVAWERLAFSRCDLAIACSEEDRGAIRRLRSGLPVAVVPNSIDVESYSPRPSENGHTILYLGGMDWFPNRDAVEYFASRILPIIQISIPEAKFRIAGRSPSPSFLRRFNGVPQVEFTGTLPDLRPAIAEATIVVVPLRIGSGTRFKILEAGAMGKPIVSTTLGAEGLAFNDGEELILADNPAAFAAAVVSLLNNPERCGRLGRAARKRTVQNYGVPALIRSVENMLEELYALKGLDGAARPERIVTL